MNPPIVSHASHCRVYPWFHPKDKSRPKSLVESVKQCLCTEYGVYYCISRIRSPFVTLHPPRPCRSYVIPSIKHHQSAQVLRLESTAHHQICQPLVTWTIPDWPIILFKKATRSCSSSAEVSVHPGNTAKLANISHCARQ